MSLEGAPPTPNQKHKAHGELPGAGASEREEAPGGRGAPRGTPTHKRMVEATRKARSRKLARAERMEVMTIISPLRRPGHVSMDPEAFPEHTAAAQRLLFNLRAVTSPPMLTPKA